MPLEWSQRDLKGVLRAPISLVNLNNLRSNSHLLNSQVVEKGKRLKGKSDTFPSNAQIEF